LKYGTSPRFELKRGIIQGYANFLPMILNNSPVQGISIAGKEMIINQLADDTTLSERS
jgi:hypothetical protein